MCSTGLETGCKPVFFVLFFPFCGLSTGNNKKGHETLTLQLLLKQNITYLHPNLSWKLFSVLLVFHLDIYLLLLLHQKPGLQFINVTSCSSISYYSNVRLISKLELEFDTKKLYFNSTLNW